MLFTHDSVHGIASALSGFSTGYLITLLLEQIAKKSQDEGLNVGAAMQLGTVMIQSGVMGGVLVGLMLAKLATL